MSANLLLYVEEFTAGVEFEGVPEKWNRTGRKEWFESMPMHGREFLQAQQMQATVTHKLLSVYFAGANPRLRLTAGEDANKPARVFNVESVVDVEEKHRHLEWMCQEVV